MTEGRVASVRSVTRSMSPMVAGSTGDIEVIPSDELGDTDHPTPAVGTGDPRPLWAHGEPQQQIRSLVLVAVLALSACESEPTPFSDAENCEELSAAFEAMPVSDDASERRAVGDAYRERFRELDCSL